MFGSLNTAKRQSPTLPTSTVLPGFVEPDASPQKPSSAESLQLPEKARCFDNRTPDQRIP